MIVHDQDVRAIEAARTLRNHQVSSLVLPPPSLSLVFASSVLGLWVYARFADQLDIHAVVLWVIYVAAVVAGIVGFAFSPICGAMLVHLMRNQVHIVEVLLMSSVAIQVLNTWSVRRFIDWQALPSFVLGGLLSVPLGVYFLLHVSQHTFAVVLGGLLVGYGTMMVFRKRPITLHRDLGRFGDFLAGLVGGVTGGFAGFPSVLVTIRCSMKGWSKNRQRGVFQPFIMVMQLATLATIHFESPHSISFSGFAYMPAALLGTWAGLVIFQRLSDRQFASMVNSLLIASGAALIVF